MHVEHCGQCGAPLEPGDRFCGDCGASLAGCPLCGAPVVAGKRFCRSCGHSLLDSPQARPGSAATGLPPRAPAAVTPEPAPVAERRVCSVLFCDLAGFTPLAESRDPEAVRELLSRYFEIARTITGRYGGVVEKFIGDAVVAVWGTPAASENDAERAVRAGLDLVAAVAELGQDAGVPGLGARTGVVTGEVAVTVGAQGEGMVAGDAVNTAARVQSQAGTGSLLADEATMRLAGSAVLFADAGEHALKGKSQPLRLWRAVRVLAEVGGLQRVDGLEALLTGRDAELRTVRELFHASAERRVPRLVLVAGPAGVGKSRLSWEFRKYIDGLKDEVWWHQGRCLSYGDGVAFWALAQAVRQRLSIAEEDTAEVASARLASGLDELIYDPAERGYVGVRLGRLLGVAVAGDNGAPLAREELFAGWRLFFERLAAESPVVLLIEDAHHADAGLLDFLDYLVDWVRNLPVYLLVLARSELIDARPGFGSGRNRITLTLDPLDAASMDQLVDALVPGMPDPARARITAQAQGIPLFAVETVRSLIDRDIVQPSEGTYRLTGDIGELAVPDSLHALLAARLDALAPGVRRLVADAAVLGSSFPAEALIGVSGQDESAVRAALSELVRREVLTLSADRLSPERGSYQFAQQMLRQVAYDTLSRRDRKARHLAVAMHLRQAFAGDGEEITDVIARHYLDALDAVPEDPDAGEIRGHALTALTRAGERAARTGAPGLAVASYATAAQLALVDVQDGGSAAATLWERAAAAAITNADHAAAIEQAGQARELYRRCGDTRAAARAHTIAGEALRRSGRYRESRDELTAALAVLREHPDADTVRALSELAKLEAFAGAPEADALSAEALTSAQDLAVDDATLAELFTTRGLRHSMASRRPQAAAYFREAARLATRGGDSLALGRALINLSDAVTVTDPAAGAEAARDAAIQMRRAGAREYVAFAVINLAGALLMTGDWDGAEAEFTQALDGDGLADMEFLACYRAWLAALRGDTSAAEHALAGLPSLRTSDDPQDQAVIAVAEGFSAAARGEPAAALGCARAALAHAGALGISNECLRWAWPLAARAAYDVADYSAIAELLTLLDGYQPGQLAPMVRAERDLVRARQAASVDGDEAAAAAFAAAVRSLSELSSPYHFAHGLLDHAEHLLRIGDEAAARAALEEARDIAQRLRCQPLRNRIESTASSAQPQPRIPA